MQKGHVTLTYQGLLVRRGIRFVFCLVGTNNLVSKMGFGTAEVTFEIILAIQLHLQLGWQADTAHFEQTQTVNNLYCKLGSQKFPDVGQKAVCTVYAWMVCMAQPSALAELETYKQVCSIPSQARSSVRLGVSSCLWKTRSAVTAFSPQTFPCDPFCFLVLVLFFPMKVSHPFSMHYQAYPRNQVTQLKKISSSPLQ